GEAEHANRHVDGHGAPPVIRSRNNGPPGPAVPLTSGVGEADQREMTERRHRAPLEKADAAVAPGPVGEAAEGEFRPPAEPARQRRKSLLEQPSRAALGSDVI